MGGISRSAGDAWPTLTQLVHLVYASLAVPQFNEHEIPALLEQSRKANAGRELTGLLLYIEEVFSRCWKETPMRSTRFTAALPAIPSYARDLDHREPIAQEASANGPWVFRGRHRGGRTIGRRKRFSSNRPRALRGWTAGGQRSSYPRFAPDGGAWNAPGRIGDGPSLTKDVCKPEFDVSFAFQRSWTSTRTRYSRTRRWSAGRATSPPARCSNHRTVAAARVRSRCAPARDRAGGFARLGEGLSLNFLPHSLETFPDAISSTLDAARAAGIAERRIFSRSRKGS